MVLKYSSDSSLGILWITTSKTAVRKPFVRKRTESLPGRLFAIPALYAFSIKSMLLSVYTSISCSIKSSFPEPFACKSRSLNSSICRYIKSRNGLILSNPFSKVLSFILCLISAVSSPLFSSWIVFS